MASSSRAVPHLIETQRQEREAEIHMRIAMRENIEGRLEEHREMSQEYAQLRGQHAELQVQADRLEAELQTKDARIAQLELANGYMSRPLSESEMRKRRKGE